MAYTLQLNEDRVTRFLRDFPELSRQGRVRLFANLHSGLRLRGDHYRQDPARRLGPNSRFFWFEIVLSDVHGDGRIRQFEFSFVVNDEAAKYGVLQIEYVQVAEHTP